MNSQSPAVMWPWALLAAVLVFALYVLFPSHFYNGDAIQVVLDVERDVKLTSFYHPSGSPLYEPGYLENPAPSGQTLNLRYFLDYPMLTLVSRLWMGLGLPSGSLIGPILLYRALMGAVSVFFASMLMYKLRPVRWVALVVASGIGLSAAHWTYATDMYQSITLVALVTAAFYALAIQARKANPLEPVGLAIIGVILAFATLHNILGVLAAGAIGLAILALPTDRGWGARLRAGVVYGLAFVIVAGGVYAGVRALLPSTQGQSNPFQWSDDSGNTQSSFFGDFSPLEDGLRAFLGLAKSQVIYPGITVRYPQGLRDYWEANPGTPRLLMMGFYIVVMGVMALSPLILFLRRRRLPPRQRWLYVLLAGLLVFYSGFNWYWLPSDVHYWLVPTLCLWVMVGLCLAHLAETAPRLRPYLLPVSALALVVIFAFNSLNQFLPEATRPNALIAQADQLQTNTTSKDLFLSDGDPLDFYLAYFSGRNVLATNIVSTQANADISRVSALATEQTRRVLADGGTLYFYTGNRDAEALPVLAALIGLPTDTRFEPVWEIEGRTIYRLAT
jgi:hypothetical protein